MHINAFLRDITRIRWLMTGGFRGWPILKRHFWLQRSKGRCHGNQTTKFWPKLAKNHKNGHNFSCKRHIHASMHGLFLWLGLCHWEIHLWHSRTQGTKWCYHGNQFWDKIAMNAYKCISTTDNENVITYNRGFSWSTNPKKRFRIARV